MNDVGVGRQRDYYARTATEYDDAHVGSDGEHEIALRAFRGIVDPDPPQSILDIGAGTGRGMRAVQRWWPSARIVGVEPVAELRAVGHARGIDQDRLMDGDVQRLAFPDDSFDFVIETGVLHHVPDPRRAVAEMVRVARRGVMISDGNRYGQGSSVGRLAKGLLRRSRLFDPLIWVQTRGKRYKWSEGDGVFYSYSLFDELPGLTAKFPRQYMLNTSPCIGTDLRSGASSAMILALKLPATGIATPLARQ